MVKFEKISKRFNKEIILDEVSLTMKKNNCCAVIGKNGTGKTTLFKILFGILKQDSGTITFKNSEEKLLSVQKGEIGFSSGSDFLIDELTGMEFLRFISYVYNISTIISDLNIINLFNYFFDDEKDINRRIESYSFGMRQKLSICASLIHKPQVLILDEPFAGLDPFSANRLIDFLKKYIENRTLLISSHDLSLVSKIATHIVILDNHRFIYSDTISNFTDNGYKNIDHSLFEIIKPKENKFEETLNFILEND